MKTVWSLLSTGAVARRTEVGLVAAVGVMLWTYLGYPVAVSAIAAARNRRQPPSGSPQPPDDELPTFTVVIAALDEEAVIAAKLADVRRLDYPAAKLEVIVVADGSTDRTAAIARDAGVTVRWSPDAAGKSAAVNAGVAAATSELVCLTDANCALAPGSLRALAAAFRDPAVAVVSGAKTVVGTGSRGGGEGLYWRMESYVKEQESVLGVTTGAPGEICGLRRSYTRPIPAGVLNDDYHLTCDALVRGFQVRFAPGAVAVEEMPVQVRGEFERRSRVAAGTWQTTLAHWRLLDPRRGWVALAFGSHRVLRSLVVPPLLPVVAVLSAALPRESRVKWILLTAQVLGYGAAAAGLRVESRLTAPFLQLVLTNASTLAGALRWARGRQPLQWQRVQRGEWVSQWGTIEP